MRMRPPERHELDPIEIASRDEIAALQLQRLRWTLRHAYDHVAHYRSTFDRAGVHPDDLRTLADLAKFPTTSKDDLRRSYPFGMFAVPRQQVARIHASSGTTGKPTVVGYTKQDIATWAEVCARSIRAAGGRAATSSTSSTATACSPAASARITGRSGSAARWCRCRAA